MLAQEDYIEIRDDEELGSQADDDDEHDEMVMLIKFTSLKILCLFFILRSFHFCIGFVFYFMNFAENGERNCKI